MRTASILIEQQGDAAFDRLGLRDAAGTTEARQRDLGPASQASGDGHG
ncbi:MAG: hypothetical protein ACREVS_03325 [Burkholderiales bacterium]